MPQPLTVPHIFSLMAPGPVPMRDFDENFAYILQNLGPLIEQFFTTLPTTLPSTPSTIWNNGGVICITDP